MQMTGNQERKDGAGRTSVGVKLRDTMRHRQLPTSEHQRYFFDKFAITSAFRALPERGALCRRDYADLYFESMTATSLASMAIVNPPSQV